MKKTSCILLSIAFASVVAAQKLGTKKNTTLQLIGYACGDACAITWKDVKSGILYGFDNVDEKTKDNGILREIQRMYYANDESDQKIKGKTYRAIIEYRTTDEYENVSPDEPARKTGKKRTGWMISFLERQ